MSDCHVKAQKSRLHPFTSLLGVWGFFSRLGGRGLGFVVWKQLPLRVNNRFCGSSRSAREIGIVFQKIGYTQSLKCHPEVQP